jgi:hypothetical protein
MAFWNRKEEYPMVGYVEEGMWSGLSNILPVTNKDVRSLSKEQEVALVEEIHDEFYSSSEKEESKAQALLDSIIVDKKLQDKVNTLNALGFVGCKEVDEFRKQESKINPSRILIDTINAYRVMYPNHKFITKEEVVRICKKYSLVLGDCNRFIGNIPDRNLKDIKDFVIADQHQLWSVFNSFGNSQEMFGNVTGMNGYAQKVSNFAICAPLKDMDVRGMRLDGVELKKVQPPDPVVLCKVPQGFIIVTAWGPEADDELVKNHNNN